MHTHDVLIDAHPSGTGSLSEPKRPDGTWDMSPNTGIREESDGAHRTNGRRFVPYVQDPPAALGEPDAHIHR
jgi:hypothetical protein